MKSIHNIIKTDTEINNNDMFLIIFREMVYKLDIKIRNTIPINTLHDINKSILMAYKEIL